jgi:hypothetical protein
MSDYVSLEEMKNTLELQNLTYKDDDLREAITAASRSIDNYCGRTFYSGGTADVRYYTATSTTYLDVDDIVSIASFKTDYDGDGVYETTWTQGTDYALEPANAVALSEPFTTIRILYPRTSLRLPAYVNGVQVTGQFGWSQAPATVKRATRILSARFVKRGDAPFGVIGIGFDGSSVRVPSVDPDLHFLLDPYAKGSGVMVA